jgi:hypothetical protein
MKVADIQKYDDNLSRYSLIVRGVIKSQDEIIDCIRIFEYFEDYEKCKHLRDILLNSKDGEKIR